ncbi:MAG: hypothetical protein FWB72_03860 [Firmicutes bacterium]|nr:hypothetical protein [Bacillota bacterium]
MDLKKDWGKLCLAVVALVGAVFALIVILGWNSAGDGEDGSFAFFIAPMLAAIMFFLAVTISNVLKLFEGVAKFAGLVWLVLGLVATIMMIVHIAGDNLGADYAFLTAIRDGAEALNQDVPSEITAALRAIRFTPWVFLFAFGLIPLAKGVVKTLNTFVINKDEA